MTLVGTILSVILIALTPGCWWAVTLVGRALRRDPAGPALRLQLVYFTATALAATALGVIGLNYLTGSHLPRFAGFALLVGALIVLSLPLHLFLIAHYRRR